MCDLPENLQIKREPSPLSTPENKSSNNIKAKLNLHVKRRLQDYSHATEGNDSSCNNTQILVDIKQEPVKTETLRQKRPYNKRTDKKTSTKCFEASTILSNAAGTSTTQRKYKHRIKQNQPEVTANTNCIEEPVAGYNANMTTDAISAGDEDEIGHDGESKAAKEKEKCPDILSMVLSMKKRSLMQDPEVKKFLKDIMEVIKS